MSEVHLGEAPWVFDTFPARLKSVIRHVAFLQELAWLVLGEGEIHTPFEKGTLTYSTSSCDYVLVKRTRKELLSLPSPLVHAGDDLASSGWIVGVKAWLTNAGVLYWYIPRATLPAFMAFSYCYPLG
jgi:hypothetical protein